MQPIDLDFADGGQVVVKDQYDLPLALPASIDEHGQISLLVDLPPLAPTHADLADYPDLTWQIDVDTAEFRVPRMRGVNRLCGLGVIQRGLILRCAACKDLAFIPLDDTGSTNTCRRCGAANQLTQARWNHPIDEPTWWYDLHPAARELLAADAGVGLLAAQHLQRTARNYEDISELEFVRGKDPIAEADLLAVVEGRVVLGEAKTTPTLGTKRQRTAKAKKIATIAATVRADEVLLCTTSTTEWSSTDLEAIRSALNSELSGIALRSAIRTLTGLGTGVVDKLHK